MTELKSALTEIFGENPIAKTLDFFLMYPNFDYSKSQVAKEAKISRVTMEHVWKKLIKKNVIKKTRDMGKGELYRLNTENPKVRALMRFDFELSNASLENERIEVGVSRRR